MPQYYPWTVLVQTELVQTALESALVGAVQTNQNQYWYKKNKIIVPGEDGRIDRTPVLVNNWEC